MDVLNECAVTNLMCQEVCASILMITALSESTSCFLRKFPFYTTDKTAI